MLTIDYFLFWLELNIFPKKCTCLSDMENITWFNKMNKEAPY